MCPRGYHRKSDTREQVMHSTSLSSLRAERNHVTNQTMILPPRGRLTVTLSLAVAVLLCLPPSRSKAQIDVTEASIVELQEAMESGAVTSEDITRMYLSRIRAYDKAGPNLNTMIWVNWDAVTEAHMLDRERQAIGPRGVLHGIPIILKDN